MLKRKQSNLVISIIVLISLILTCYLAITNIIVGLDFLLASNSSKADLILSNHPHLPLIRVFNSLLALQTSNKAGIATFFYAMTLFFSSLGVIEIIYIVLQMVEAVMLYTNKDEVFVGFWITFIANIIFLIQCLVSAIFALEAFYFNRTTLLDLSKGFGIFYIVVGALVLVFALIGIIYVVLNYKKSQAKPD